MENGLNNNQENTAKDNIELNRRNTTAKRQKNSRKSHSATDEYNQRGV